MKRLRDWMGKLRGKRSQTNGTRPPADLEAWKLEEQQRLLKQHDKQSEHDPGRYDPNP
jgi:hypothetical protein